MPGYSFDSAAQIMALLVVGFARGAAFEMSLGETVYFKFAKNEVFGVEQEDQFIQPGDQQRDDIVTFRGYLPAHLQAYLLRRDHQAFHALSRVYKQFRQCTTISVQANIGGMLEYLIGFLRRHCESRNTAPANPARLLDVTCMAVPLLSLQGLSPDKVILPFFICQYTFVRARSV